MYLSGHNIYLSGCNVDIYNHIHIYWALNHISVQVQYIDIHIHINIHINIHIYGQLNHISVRAQYISVRAPILNPHNPHGPEPVFLPY